MIWKQTALSRACFNSRPRSLLRQLYQRIFIQAPVVQGIRHRIYFMFLDRVKSLWAWVWILKSGLENWCFFLFIFFYIYIYCISLTITTIFKNNNKYTTTITYLTVNGFQSHKKSHISFKWCHLSSDVLCLTLKCVCTFMYTTHLVFLN